jgi:hypothetical protein
MPVLPPLEDWRQPGFPRPLGCGRCQARHGRRRRNGCQLLRALLANLREGLLDTQPTSCSSGMPGSLSCKRDGSGIRCGMADAEQAGLRAHLQPPQREDGSGHGQ